MKGREETREREALATDGGEKESKISIVTVAAIAAPHVLSSSVTKQKKKEENRLIVERQKSDTDR